MKAFWHGIIQKYFSIPIQKRRAFLIVVIALIAAIDLYNLGDDREGPVPSTTSFTRFMADARAGDIASISYYGGSGTLTYKDGHVERVFGALPDAYLVELADKGIDVSFVPPSNNGDLVKAIFLLVLAVPGLLLCFHFLRGGRRLSLGGKPKIVDPNTAGLRFDDIAGQPQAKSELAEIIDFLKDPDTFTRLGAKAPKGALMIGPPGVGKTLLARAVAGETNARFITASGADFRESYMGVGAAKVRDMFKLARKHAPAIIFIDEIEVMGRKRQSGGGATGGTRNEEEATLNALLVEMDGFSTDLHIGWFRRMLNYIGVPLPDAKDAAVVVLAATNRPDMMDDALLRPGRFDRHVHFEHLDVNGRHETLLVHARNKQLAPDVDLREVAKSLTGSSGADLAKLMNEAAIRATRRGAPAIARCDIDNANVDIKLGRERQGSTLLDDDKLAITVHEAGHALLGLLAKHARRPTRASIIPRGRSLGAVLTEQNDERKIISRDRLMADLIVALGGRAAEFIRFGAGGVSTGAEDDFNKASFIARKMAGSWSMAGDEPTLSLADDSSMTARTQVEAAAQKILNEAWNAALQLLHDNDAAHAALVDALLERETIEGEEIAAIVAGASTARAA